jgi:hypothetical protein
MFMATRAAPGHSGKGTTTTDPRPADPCGYDRGHHGKISFKLQNDKVFGVCADSKTLPKGKPSYTQSKFSYLCVIL